MTKETASLLPDVPEDKDAPCNICGRGWPYHAERCSYAVLASGHKRLRAALEDILDAAERARAGFPIESEEWYARRDYARIVLEDTK